MPVERRGWVIALEIGSTGNGRNPIFNGRRQPSCGGTSRMTRECQVPLPRVITTTRQSAPLRRIGTFGLAVGAACAFSLGIAGQVLTFRTRARLSFAPPPCRMPLGQSQDIPQTDPRGVATPRFWHHLIRFRHVISRSLPPASPNHTRRNLVPT